MFLYVAATSSQLVDTTEHHRDATTTVTRTVAEDTKQVTIICDRDLMDYTALDKYVQHVYPRGTTISGVRDMIKNGEIIIKCPQVVILMGNNQIPWPPGISPTNQVKKLVQAIFVKYKRRITKVWIGTVLPRPDREVELERIIQKVNVGYFKAVKELKRHNFEGKCTEILTTHLLFLEKYRYVDILTGHSASHLRIIKPTDVNFVAGKADLNLVGLYRLKAHMLQKLGIMAEISSWTGVPTRWEPKEIRNQKRAAWLSTHGKLESNATMCHGAPLRLGLPCTKLKFYWLLGYWPE